VDPPEPGTRKPGFIHFPIGENFGLEYYEQLNSERKERRLRLGQASTIWIKIRERNEALDTLVGALAVRKSLPRYAEQQLQFSNKPDAQPAPATKIDTIGPAVLENATHTASERDEGGRVGNDDTNIHSQFQNRARTQPYMPRRPGWMQKRTD
jgi:phage terminase large subunit GpA-like protein